MSTPEWKVVNFASINRFQEMVWYPDNEDVVLVGGEAGRVKVPGKHIYIKELKALKTRRSEHKEHNERH